MIIIFIDNMSIKICNNVVETLYNHIQQGKNTKESGGILVGKENKSNHNIIINNITTPMKHDKSSYASFKRLDKKHISYFNDLYNESNQTLRYIGEWHTHDEAVPHFSRIDLNNWKKICKSTNCYEFFFHIIVGYEALGCWLINKNDNEPTLLEMCYWRMLL